MKLCDINHSDVFFLETLYITQPLLAVYFRTSVSWSLVNFLESYCDLWSV